jgi:hypothetical protein
MLFPNTKIRRARLTRHSWCVIPSCAQTGNLFLVGADLSVRPGLRAHAQVRPYGIEAFVNSMTATLYENDDFSQRRKDAKTQKKRQLNFLITLGDLGDFARDIFMLRCVRKEMIVGMRRTPTDGNYFFERSLASARPGEVCLHCL